MTLLGARPSGLTPSRAASSWSLADRRARLLSQDLTGHHFMRRWSAAADEWLRERFSTAAGPASPCALVAVGGYGRARMAPGSDLDLLLLHPAGFDPSDLADALWYPVWNEGLRLGHAVRTVSATLSLAAEDLATATGLLSARHVAGDPQLADEVAARGLVQWRRRAPLHLDWLAASVEERQAARGTVAFDPEPDIKEGRGGLRDVAALRWARRARDVLAPGDLVLLNQAEETLDEVRVALHRVSGGASNVLQEGDWAGVAADLDTDELDLRRNLAAAARVVTLVSDEAWDRVRRARRRRLLYPLRSLRPEVTPGEARGGTGDGGQAFTAPLEAAEVAVREGATLLRADVLAGVVPAKVPVPWPSSVREALVRLLMAGPQLDQAVEVLDHLGLWGRYLPEWEQVRNRPAPPHRSPLTLDRHLVATAAAAAALAHRVERGDLVCVAALLLELGVDGAPTGDDRVAPGKRGGAWSPETGDGIAADDGTVDDAAAVLAARMGFSPDEAAIIAGLVHRRDLLALAVARRDLDDQATIEQVAAEVGSVAQLDRLAVLTEAEGLAAGPGWWGPRRAGLLDELVRKVTAQLTGGSADDAAFPDERQLALLRAGELVVNAGDQSLELVAPDRPGLLWRVAGVLALHGLEVSSAAVTTVGGMALEVFTVHPARSQLVAWDRVEADLHRALEGRLAIEARLAERLRTYRRRAGLKTDVPRPPRVSFHDDASRHSTVMEVDAPDQPALLYRVTRTIAEMGLEVRVAKLATHGRRAVDTFYLAQRNGTLVTDAAHRLELQKAVEHAAAFDRSCPN